MSKDSQSTDGLPRTRSIIRDLEAAAERAAAGLEEGAAEQPAAGRAPSLLLWFLGAAGLSAGASSGITIVFPGGWSLIASAAVGGVIGFAAGAIHRIKVIAHRAGPSAGGGSHER